jgi:outer membrane protein assembly factor BamE (lipoprotein component of BamABCDE complex)
MRVNHSRPAFRAATLSALLLIVGCAAASQQASDIARAQEAGDRATVGTVQREIRVGMANAEVIEVLGSPNVVTTDDHRRESWVYDRISTQTAYSKSAGGVNVLFLAGLGAGAGVINTSQRTLTIIIKFDENSKVRDFAYRSSSF